MVIWVRRLWVQAHTWVLSSDRGVDSSVWFTVRASVYWIVFSVEVFSAVPLYDWTWNGNSFQFLSNICPSNCHVPHCYVWNGVAHTFIIFLNLQLMQWLFYKTSLFILKYCETWNLWKVQCKCILLIIIISLCVSKLWNGFGDLSVNYLNAPSVLMHDDGYVM